MNNDSNLSDSNGFEASGSEDLNQDILLALNSVSSRLTSIESRIIKIEEKLQEPAKIECVTTVNFSMVVKLF